MTIHEEAQSVSSSVADWALISDTWAVLSYVPQPIICRARCSVVRRAPPVNQMKIPEARVQVLYFAACYSQPQGRL
jgi:hypothetical protein